jgi:branched-chain amino acid aminotransferase
MLDTLDPFVHIPVAHSRLPEVDFDRLQFGRTFSDHMFLLEYANGAWQQGRIEPYGPFTLSPASMVFHYGQAIFEGMKAYRQTDGTVSLFRPGANIARFNRSAARMSMPAVPEDVFMDALTALLRVDEAWVPSREDSSLYLRPFMIATDPFIGVRPSETYVFAIFTCPVNAYYTEPVRVKVETHFTRACPGGTGAAKAAGNYAGSYFPASRAQQQGYHQLLWTDATEHAYVEESGTMNAMFVIDGVLTTPVLSDSILAGITRDSVLTLAKDLGIPTEERRVSVSELQAGILDGTVTEAFGVGTAATIAPMAAISFDGQDLALPEVSGWRIAPRVSVELDAIRRGRIEDRFGWNIPV